MAYINTTSRPAILDRARAYLETLREARARRAVYTRTFNELSALSNRDLADIGLARGNIDEIAWEHAHMG